MKHIELFEEHIPGGRASGMTIDQLAASHGVEVEDIHKQLAVGIEVEMEHTTDREKAEEIAMDHVSEDPHYYTKLIQKGIADEPAAIKKFKELYEGDWWDSHPDHPANQEDARTKMEVDYPSSKTKFTGFANLHISDQLGILIGKPEVGGGVWVVNTEDLPEEYQYCVEIGDDEWECEIASESLVNYATDLYDEGDKGEGLADWESGVKLVKLDEELRDELLESFERSLRPSHRWQSRTRSNAVIASLKQVLWELPKLQL
jgi:hypothetical protein